MREKIARIDEQERRPIRADGPHTVVVLVDDHPMRRSLEPSVRQHARRVDGTAHSERRE
jgi:hypothetical protein